jgi:SAM-dependent methyltransferase
MRDAIVCPSCRGSLINAGATWACKACGREFPALRGIADLRSEQDRFLSNEADWAFARRLDAEYDRLDFRGLLARYFDLQPDIPGDLRERQIAHILTAGERTNRWVEAWVEPGLRAVVLDLGCGTGSFLTTTRGNALGVDIALRWLVLARKRLDEAGRSDVPLACACAERLPLRDQTVGMVVASDVIEHVVDQQRTLDEAYRVLAPGGRFWMTTPNRYSLAPEPHVGVWGVGFLPRAAMPAYVRYWRGIEFHAIRTLGYSEWSKLLRSSAFEGGDIRCPALPEDEVAAFPTLKRRLARLYNRLIERNWGRAVAERVGPLFEIVCERPRTPSPATRPHSTRSTAPV